MFPVLACAQDFDILDRQVDRYLRSIDELESRYLEHEVHGKQISVERQQLIKRLEDTRKEVDRILSAKQLSQLQQAQAELASISLNMESNQLVSSNTQRPVNSGVDPRRDPNFQLQSQQKALFTPALRTSLNLLAKQSADLRVYHDMLTQQIRTLNEANRLVVERYRSQLQELERITKDVVDWNVQYASFFDLYWELADVANVRSDEEHSGVMQHLENSSDQNPGAVFLKAVTLVRLEKYDDAMTLLDRLFAVQKLQALVSAMRAETFARMGEKKKAASALKFSAAPGMADARVRMHRAMAFGVVGQLKSAENEWEIIAKTGGYALSARRGLALIQGSMRMPIERVKTKAIENAELAVQLGTEEWSCHIALAIAASANGDKERAIEAALHASSLSIGKNLDYCQEVVKTIEKGESVSWRF
jgi:Flp pilus assembly protein TadD